MLNPASVALFALFLVLRGCSGNGLTSPAHLQHQASGSSPEVLALYEAWFGHPRHISVGYSSHDPDEIARQIEHAKSLGISAFVVDWYGDREPFIDRSYALVQESAAKRHFKVAMLYDETDADDGATDEALADFTMFHDTYLAASAPGHEAYLTYEGRPVIFIFPKGRHTDWSKIRTLVNGWKPVPLLIQENLPSSDPNDFDGYYAWVSPGKNGWAPDGSNWGEDYLVDFYQTMSTKYPDKIIVGGAWSAFDDSKASWGLNRHIAPRCGKTFADTSNFWRKEVPSGDVIPFLMVETWNDYEEGSAIEPGVPPCAGQPDESH